MDALETELKDLILEALMIDDVPADFDADADLFESLGLDSVDALELAMAIRRKYGVQFDAEDDANRSAFQSLKTLAGFVRTQQAQA